MIDIKFEEGTLTFIYPRYGNPVYSFGIPTTIFKQLLPIVTKNLDALKNMQAHHEKIACAKHKQEQVFSYFKQTERNLQKITLGGLSP